MSGSSCEEIFMWCYKTPVEAFYAALRKVAEKILFGCYEEPIPKKPMILKSNPTARDTVDKGKENGTHRTP